MKIVGNFLQCRSRLTEIHNIYEFMTGVKDYFKLELIFNSCEYYYV